MLIVSITNISKGKKFEGGSPSIDQKACVFIPHVAMIPQGSSIELLNSDDVMHNLHSWSMKIQRLMKVFPVMVVFQRLLNFQR